MNRRQRSIPDILPNIPSHHQAILSLTEGYQELTRQRGAYPAWAVTFQDLIDLGLVEQQQVEELLARRRN